MNKKDKAALDVKPTSIRLSPEVVAKVKELAEKDDRSISYMIEKLLRQVLQM